MCPQSLFKLKPDFDRVIRDVLLAFKNNKNNDNKAFLVLTEGRRKKWTEIFQRRLQDSVPEILSQVKFLPRTSAGREFLRLIASADVILHPFPFGGSKTAADGLAMGVPVVAMEGNALPGRMAFSLYKTMGLEGAGNRAEDTVFVVASICTRGLLGDKPSTHQNILKLWHMKPALRLPPSPRACPVCSFVQLAIRLGRDTRYRRWASGLIEQRSSALWERREVVLEWARFISRAAGRVPPTAQEVSQ
ncbi:unnamed protein product, partial [Hapterophycus canaliculatus]